MDFKSKDRKSIDFTFLILVIALLIYGLIMVFSASSASAHYYNGDAFFFIKKQGLFAILGLFGMWIMSVIDINLIKKFITPVLLVTLVLLILVLIPGVGMEINGARRWIGISSISFQPSELAKYVIILFIANSLSVRKEPLDSFLKDLMPYLVVIALFAGLVFLEDHLSGAIVIAFLGCLILYVAGTKNSHFVALGVAGVILIIFGIIFEPYRMARFTTFLDPFKDPLGSGFQIVQSFYAIGSGGFFGLGLGQSRQKYLYIPEPHNDFIFSIICEELGFFGAVLLIILFALLIWRGIKIAMAAPDVFTSLTTTGIIGLVAFQTVVNIAVVTGSMPVTGMPLPFFSYGGSALAFLLTSMGFVLNVSRNLEKEEIKEIEE